jgi:uncharacterized protein YbjT (DUF2867 family)
MILVVGATGQLGRLVTHRLVHRGEDVRVLLRPGSRREDVTATGAHVVAGDLREPGSLRAACDEVDTVITTANATARKPPDTIDSVDRHGNRNLIDAADAAGVRRFVFISAMGADPAHPLPLLSAKGEAEQHLQATDMAWTVLRPNVFMDKLVPIVVGGPAVAGHPVTLVGSGARRHSFVAMDDVASYVVAALEHEESVGSVLTIGGPQPLSWHDVVASFERELQRSLSVRTLSPQDASTVMPTFVIDLLSALDTYDSLLDMDDMRLTYAVEPTPLADYVRTFVQSCVGGRDGREASS